jgi:hypothetical protein
VNDRTPRNFVSEFIQHHKLNHTDLIFYFIDNKLQIATTLSDLLLKEEYAYILNDVMRGGKFISAKTEDVSDFLKKIWEDNSK